LILKQDKISVTIQKILNCSKETNVSDLMEWKLSAEIAQSIDKSIIKNLMNLGKIK
jgi:hypothetical protein